MAFRSRYSFRLFPGERMSGRCVRRSGGSYAAIHHCRAVNQLDFSNDAQKELVEIVHTLRQIVCVKG
jgi:hypothetical protein